MALNLSKERRKLVQGVGAHPQVGVVAFTLGAADKDGKHTGSGVFLKIDPLAGEQRAIELLKQWGACQDAGEDNDHSYCDEPLCPYCSLSRAFDEPCKPLDVGGGS